jgi:hypothetical protein
MDLLSIRALRVSRHTAMLVTSVLIACALAPARAGELLQSTKKPDAPETFRATARATVKDSAGEAYVTIAIDKYTAPREIEKMEQALKAGGYTSFLDALRQAPVAGYVQLGDQKTPIRWARQREVERGRVISVVTDAPIYYVGGGVPGAKPKSGFDLAIVQLTMDSSGVGKGTMAAAARVKPGGPTGVEVEDYATVPVTLGLVTRSGS